jgi:hypothetical protein
LKPLVRHQGHVLEPDRLRHPRPLRLRWTRTVEPRRLTGARTGSLIVDGGGRAPAARLVTALTTSDLIQPEDACRHFVSVDRQLMSTACLRASLNQYPTPRQRPLSQMNP